MAEYRNKKTNLVWDVTDPAILKTVKADIENFEPVSGDEEEPAGKMTAAQKKATEKAAKDVNTGDKADAPKD